MTESHLQFTVRVTESAKDVDDAVRVRHAGYARHLPQFAEKLSRPEEDDFAEDVAILVAHSKIDGEPVGTLRIHSNRHRSLPLEASVRLPAILQGAHLSEAARLSVGRTVYGPLVKAALFKAFFLHARKMSVDFLVATGRSPIDRMYQAMHFQDTFEGGPFLPMVHVGNVPHRVMHFDVKDAQRCWSEAQHPLYGFVFETQHPDIQV